MLHLSANSDFASIENTSIKNPYYDLNGDNIKEHIEIYGTDALDQAIEMVLCTEPGERLFNMSMSSPLYKVLFENLTNINGIMTDIFNQIEYWVPVTIYREDAEVEHDVVTHSLKFKIPYISNDGRFKHTFNRIISK